MKWIQTIITRKNIQTKHEHELLGLYDINGQHRNEPRTFFYISICVVQL